jgi:hypothetical protein
MSDVFQYQNIADLEGIAHNGLSLPIALWDDREFHCWRDLVLSHSASEYRHSPSRYPSLVMEFVGKTQKCKVAAAVFLTSLD